ncbi:MAG: glycosyltransferase [Saprospiraceae bacterium]|nr:glycosyltransferase [Saprospiraceae bacterium]
MNILILSTTNSGGAANACIRLHQGLLSIGVNSKVLVLQKNNTKIPEIYPFLEVYEPRTLFKRLKKAPRVLLFNKKRKKNLEKRPSDELFSFCETLHDIKDHHLYNWADIINIHWVANFLDYPSFFTSNTKPIVWTLHDMLLFTGGYHYLKGFPLNSFKDLILQQYTLKKSLFENQHFTIVSPSIWLKNCAENAQELYPNATHKLIPYGIQTHIFKPYTKDFARDQLNIPKDKKIILFVAASVDGKRKGINYLLDALEKIKDKNVELAIIGKNINKLNLDPQKSHELGYLSDENLIAMAYAAADVFVIPSIEDNLPNTVIESLCCGTPVIGFDIGGIPDMIIPGKNGEICSTIDSNCLADLIITSLKTKYDRAWIRQNAVEKYDLKIQAESYLSLFKFILSQK